MVSELQRSHEQGAGPAAPSAGQAPLDGIMQRYAAGDPAAFDALYEALGPRLHRFCLRLARARGGDGVTERILFVAAFELGSLAWYVALILSAQRVPGAFRRHVERAAVVAVASVGVWLIASVR